MVEQREIPNEVLLASGVSGSQVEDTAFYLAGHNIIQAVAAPSRQEWEKRRFWSVFLTEPTLQGRAESARFIISYMGHLYGSTQNYDIFLQTLRADLNTGEGEHQSLVILKHDEAST